MEATRHFPFGRFLYFQIWHKLGVYVTTVKVLSIPVFSLFESGGLPQLGLGKSHFRQGKLFRRKRFTVVCFFHILHHHLQRGAVEDNVVCVEEPVKMLRITHQSRMEQSSAIKFVWLDEFPFFHFDVRNLFNS